MTRSGAHSGQALSLVRRLALLSALILIVLLVTGTAVAALLALLFDSLNLSSVTTAR